MMGWFTSLFGSSETAEHTVKRAVDGVYYGLDKLVYTKEEQADDKKVAVDQFLTFVTQTFNENSIRNITRRWLAWGVTGWILLNAQIAIFAALLGYDEKVKKVIEIANAFELGWVFIAVMTAYFGVQFLRK